MKKIELKDIKKIIKEKRIEKHYYETTDNLINMPMYGVYHQREWDRGYDGTSGFAGTRREFYRDFEEILEFVREYIQVTKCTECVIAPFNRMRQFEIRDEGNDIYDEIYCILKKCNVKSNSQSGIKIDLEKEFYILEAIIEGAFRGIALQCVFFNEIDVLVTPTHHFELPFWTYEALVQPKLIKSLSEKYANLIYYQRT